MLFLLAWWMFAFFFYIWVFVPSNALLAFMFFSLHAGVLSSVENWLHGWIVLKPKTNFCLCSEKTMNCVLFLLLYSVFHKCIKQSNQLKTSYTSYKTVKNQLKSSYTS